MSTLQYTLSNSHSLLQGEGCINAGLRNNVLFGQRTVIIVFK